MPKYEIEPGRYGFKKPEPIDRGRTSKEVVLREGITKTMMRQAESRASVKVAAKWLRNRPEDINVLENCDQCLDSLVETTWQTGPKDEVLEPKFDECNEHPTLVRDWVYDQMNAMFNYLEEHLDER